MPTAIVQFLESRHEHEARREAAAARRRRQEADVQARRPDSGHLDQLPAGRQRRRRTESADLVQLQDVGVNVEMTPRVTLEDDILLDLNVENSSRGADVNVGGMNIPSFGIAQSQDAAAAA